MTGRVGRDLRPDDVRIVAAREMNLRSNAVINVMLGKGNLTPDPSPGCDVTGDGQVDIADVNAVINIMLGKQ